MQFDKPKTQINNAHYSEMHRCRSQPAAEPENINCSLSITVVQLRLIMSINDYIPLVIVLTNDARQALGLSCSHEHFGKLYLQNYLQKFATGSLKV